MDVKSYCDTLEKQLTAWKRQTLKNLSERVGGR
jgi:hypothetical protein